MVKSIVHPENNELITVSLNGQCRIWDFNTLEPKGRDRFRMLPDSFLGWVAGNELLYQGINGNIYLWTRSNLNGAKVALPIPKKFLNGLKNQGRRQLMRALSTDLQWQVVSVKNQVVFFGICQKTKSQEPDFEIPLPHSVKTMKFSADNQRLFALCEDDSVCMIHMRGKEIVGSPLRHDVAIASMFVSPNNSVLAVQCVDHSIWLWSLDDPDVKATVVAA